MSNYLIHHGTKGMKWGIRKYQNTDGSLTPAGKQRYGGGSIQKSKFKENRHDRAARAAQRDADNLRKHGYTKEADAVQKVADIQRNKAAAKRAKNKGNASSFGNRFKKRVDQGVNSVKEKAKNLHANDVLNKAADNLDDRATKDWFNDKGKMVNGKNVAASALRSISNRNMSELRSTIDSYDFFNDTKYGEKFDNVMDYVDTLVKGKR